jgi:hypothetical protein
MYAKVVVVGENFKIVIFTKLEDYPECFNFKALYLKKQASFLYTYTASSANLSSLALS